MQATCRAALDALGHFVGPETGCKIVFAKVRPLMLLSGSNDINQALVHDFRCLEVGGITLEVMNAEFIAAEAQARIDGSYSTYPPERGAWTPPAWRAPYWGPDDTAYHHNMAMDRLRDKILHDWRTARGSEIDMSKLKMYMTYMAVHSIQNHIDEPGSDDEIHFNGEL